MTRMGWRGAGAAALLLALAALATPALAGEAGWVERWKAKLPFDLTGEIEAGGQVVGHSGNSATFDEYRDLDSMPTIPNLYLLGEDKQKTRFMELGGVNLNRNDAYYFMNYGRYNYYKFFFEFDRIPHTIANNAQTIYSETSKGVFSIPSPQDTTLATALTTTNRAGIISAVDALLQPTKLGFQTDAARFGGNWLVTPEIELGLSYSFTNRQGRTPLGTVIGSPGGNVVELAIPRDEQYHEIKAGAEYVRDRYQVRLNYTFSAFENDVKAIEWENPCGAGAGSGCPNQSGIGRYSTMPDNQAHTWSLAAGYSLPWWNTRLTAAGSYAFWRQDEEFLPYTSLAGAGNTTDAGQRSPDAKMDVGMLNLGLSTRPVRDVNLRFKYRLYDLENDTEEHTFTNVLAGSSDVTPVGASVHTSEPLDFRKQNASADASWRVLRPLTLRVGYEWERWDRDHREVGQSNEHIVKAGADIQPLPWVLGRFTYAHGVRTIGGDYTPLGGNADSLPQFRKFDESDRTRDKGDVLVQVSPLDTLTLSGTFFIQNDGYWNTDFGVWHSQAWGYSGDISWAPTERLGLFAGYARDYYRSKQQNCFISITPVGGVIPPPADALPGSVCGATNIFEVRPRDTLDAVNVGANYTVIPAKLDLSAGYRFAFGKSRYQLGSVPGGAAASEPGDVPDVKNQFHVFNIVARYFLTPNWVLKLGYQYERYDENDFTTDDVPSALANLTGATATADVRSILLGAQHPDYEAHIVALSVGFRF